MTTAPASVRFDRTFFMLLADYMAVGVAVSLPWSTSATGIFIAAWLLALLPTLDVATVRRELATAAGGLPVLLWGLGVVGMLWADVSWTERFRGLDSFHRLLMLPLLLAQFRRSEHGRWVIYGFFISSATVLLVSYGLVLTPGLTWRGSGGDGVPVHDYIYQSSAFLICAFAVLGWACDESRQRHWPTALEFIAIAALFLGNIAFVATSRTTLVVFPVLALLLGWRQLRGRGLLAALVLVGVVGAGAWFTSAFLRFHVLHAIEEIQDYRATNAVTSAGMHAALFKESVSIVARAPIIGHGTGSIPDEFRRIAAGESGATGVAAVNPHNQTFGVAIQLGFLGAAVLWSMWAAHFYLFRGGGVFAWVGAVIVVENVVSSFFFSHLFDFSNGWLYVFGIGVLGGMALREGAARSATAAPV
jgi:hypothetical protein